MKRQEHERYREKMKLKGKIYAKIKAKRVN
jgi:hypothetical protein